MPERRPIVLEPLRRTISDARAFASVAHREQLDKAGKPYIQHLQRVVDRVTERACNRQGCTSTPLPPAQWIEMAQVAWLHDVIEDTEYTADDLLDEGFSPSVVTGVLKLSNRGGMTYRSFIISIAQSASLPTILVKIADVEDNSDPARLALLPAETRARLEKKYGAALPVLKAAAERLGWKEERS